LYKVKGSKHFGYAFPVYSEEEIKEKLEWVKKEHHSARHHCYAWRLGLDMKKFRANDDGEPSNSAGKPILGQIQSFDLTNVFIVVVRYFGGVKLGVGGLIDAYRTAAKLAIQDNEIITRQVHHFYKLKFDYAAMPKVMSLLKAQNLEMKNTDFQLNCSLETDIRASASSAFEISVTDIEGAEFELLQIG
jgi:uncharacterized YigZ family protein